MLLNKTENDINTGLVNPIKKVVKNNVNGINESLCLQKVMFFKPFL